MGKWTHVLVEELHRVDILAGGHDKMKVVGHQGRLEGLVPSTLADEGRDA